VFVLNRANRNRVASGFGVERSDGNVFKRNRAFANTGDGFYLLFASSYNTLTRNVACRNTGVDASDHGSGVGNVWRANRFCTSDI
jgi:parallel beta-helix repeat protein